MYKINITLACIFIVFTGCESKKPIKIQKKGVNRNMEDLKSRISHYIETGIKGVYHDPKLDIKDGHIVRLFIVGGIGGISVSPDIISSFPSRKDELDAIENRAKYDALVRFSKHLEGFVINSENGTTKIKTDFNFKNVKLVGSTLKDNDSCRVVYQWDRILEENSKYLLDGEIAEETLLSENQDSGLSNTCKKIWFNNILVVEEIYSSKSLNNIESINFVLLQKRESTGMPYFYFNIKVEENSDGELISKKIVSMVWDESGKPISPANGFKVDPSFDLKRLESQ
ncbi:MAG: hypothetical protein WCJ72_12495 [Chryseobacterium sp.]